MRKIDMNNLTAEDRVWLRSWNREIPEPDSAPDEDESEDDEDAEGDGDGSDDTEDTGSETEDAEETKAYEDMSKDELKAECGERDLPKGGTVAELVARLEADDEA